MVETMVGATALHWVVLTALPMVACLAMSWVVLMEPTTVETMVTASVQLSVHFEALTMDLPSAECLVATTVASLAHCSAGATVHS